MSDDMDRKYRRWANRGPYIRRKSGRNFPFLGFTSGHFNIPDIAYHLAGINRYTGGSRISVAQHSVVGAKMAEFYYPEAPLLPAKMLIHDVAESVTGDISSPFKALLKSWTPEFKVFETGLDRAVEEFFGLTFLDDPLVKEVDDRMWLTERLTVYAHCDQDEIAEDTANVPLEPFDAGNLDVVIKAGWGFFEEWDPETAETEWLLACRARFPDVWGAQL